MYIALLHNKQTAFHLRYAIVALSRKYQNSDKGLSNFYGNCGITTLALAGIFRGGSEVHERRACKEVAAWGIPGAEPPEAGQV